MMAEVGSMLSRQIESHVKIFKKRPIDIVGFLFIASLSLLVYYYSIYIILPEMAERWSPMTYFFMKFVVSHWLIGGVISNMVVFRMRDSSIRNKILMQPMTKTPQTMYGYSAVNGGGCACGDSNCQDVDHDLKERVKCMGEHFSATPFQDEKLWHICASCEIFVPPKTWHCHVCDICILRRDHHCVFTMGCVGEENHCNFIGLLFYLGVGCSLCAIFSFVYNIYYLEIVWWMFFVKIFVPFYSILYEFSILNILTGLTAIGQLSAWGVFGFYMYLAFRGQTVAEWSKARCLANPPKKTFSYANLTEFLGPNPFLRILNPFHSVICKSIITQPNTEDSNYRKGL